MTRKEKKTAKGRFKKTYRHPVHGAVMARLIDQIGHIRRIIARRKADPMPKAMGYESADWWRLQPKSILDMICRERLSHG